jgi:DNA-directed RNA polymerase specialized sigma24 family protein
VVNGCRSELRRAVVNGCRGELRKLRVRRRARVDSPSLNEPAYRELLDVLSRLPPRQRAAVVFRYYEGLGEDDIARALRSSIASARSLLHRGLVNLRRQLEYPES